ncbi:MAG: aminotransferase class I/II-fold pyridoxal phosphate-dependent enzyme [Thermoplasmatota archaeon]
MNVQEFELERWFAEYEHNADIMLAESGIRSLDSDRFDLDAGKVGYVIPTSGKRELRDKVGEMYGLDGDNILFTCGTQEANFLIFISLLSKYDHAVVVTPTYQALHSVPESICPVCKVTLNPPDWKLDVDKVEDAVKENTKMIVLNNPNNPTGRYHPLEKVKKIYEIAEENGIYLLCDEVYRELVVDPIPPVAGMGKYGISTTSLTKAYGLAGTRFGWIAADEEIIEKAWKWKDYTTISPSIFGHHIAEQVFNGKREEILKENIELAHKNRNIVDEFVRKYNLDWYYPFGVNGFIKIPDNFDSSVQFCREFFEEKKVVLAPGKVFGFDKYFRIGFGLETDILEEGLRRLSDFIESKS